MSMKRRVELLEARETEKPADDRAGERGYWTITLYLRAVENHQREQQGLPPIPYTEEELGWKRELDGEFLQDALPRMRGDPGWQSAQAQARLDEWQKDLEERK
jgi:hypothetical protein